jgi:3-hydroxyacyl-CoA dehydrogenase
MTSISDVDWVIEVVIERLDIKKIIFEQVDQYRKKGSLVSSNTSGIPINSMLDERSDDFQKHFCGSHFFNPPRYLSLLEIIPTEKTDPEVISFLEDYGRRFLGKEVVICKDTPAFIANRIGVFSIMSLFHYAPKTKFTVDEIDLLTGPVLGRPKSATFRTCDVVGLDTLVHVANGVKENCPNDEMVSLFEIPDYISKMVELNRLGSKTGEGFYKKVKKDGKSVIQSLDLSSQEYSKKNKNKFKTIGDARAVDDVVKRMSVLYNGSDEAGEFYRYTFHQLFAYVSGSGSSSFYSLEKSSPTYYDQNSSNYVAVPGFDNRISIKYLKEENKVWGNNDATIVDIGDGILNLEFHTKMNVIGGGILEGINKAISLAEESYKGLVIYNEGQNFSAGANVGMIFMMAIEQDYDELRSVVKTFQDTMMRIRYSSIPVVIAPHALTLGGGCEMCLHADKIVAHAESYIGLVEFGIGVIPGGGGTKEFALRTSDEFHDGDIRINTLRNRFLTVGQAKVATSAHEAFDLGYLRKGIDEVIVSRKDQLSYAKKCALQLADKGYTKPVERTDIQVLGNEGMGIVYVGADTMFRGNYISEHDKIISEKLGYVLCGGDLSTPQTVSEQYLLKLERDAFVELCATRKTLERLESFVNSGKILRN